MPLVKSVDAIDKLDASLWDLYSQGKLDYDDQISIVIKTTGASVPSLSRLVEEMGARVQRQMPRLGFIVAWTAANLILRIAANSEVESVSVEDEFIIA